MLQAFPVAHDMSDLIKTRHITQSFEINKTMKHKTQTSDTQGHREGRQPG